MRSLGMAAVSLACCWATATRGAGYARPELLVEAQELIDYAFNRETTLSTAGVVILATRSDAPTEAKPGDDNWWWRWRKLKVREWKSAFGEGADAVGWSKRIAQVIPNPDVTVVVADAGVTPNAARAWWMLRYWGVADVRVFNGSAQDLDQAKVGMNLSSYRRSLTKKPFVGHANPERVATRPEVVGLGVSTCLIDTRSETEVARGVIPGAAHADWVRFVDPATGKMRPADELAAILNEVGFDPERPAIAYCRSGGRASVVAFAMELMGGKQVANYVGSWNDWTSDPTSPIARLGDPAP